MNIFTGPKFQPTCSWYVNVRYRRADGRTDTVDRQTTFQGITALCVASRGKNRTRLPLPWGTQTPLGEFTSKTCKLRNRKIYRKFEKKIVCSRQLLCSSVDPFVYILVHFKFLASFLESSSSMHALPNKPMDFVENWKLSLIMSSCVDRRDTVNAALWRPCRRPPTL